MSRKIFDMAPFPTVAKTDSILLHPDVTVPPDLSEKAKFLGISIIESRFVDRDQWVFIDGSGEITVGTLGAKDDSHEP